MLELSADSGEFQWVSAWGYLTVLLLLVSYPHYGIEDNVTIMVMRSKHGSRPAFFISHRGFVISDDISMDFGHWD